MALDNIKFCLKTKEFNLRADTSKRLCVVDKSREFVKKWIKEHDVIFLTGNWKDDRLDLGDGEENIPEDKIMDMWTKDNLENVQMSYGNIEILDLHLTLS